MYLENSRFLATATATATATAESRCKMKQPVYGGHDPSTLLEAVVAKVLESYFVVYPRRNEGDLTVADSITVSMSDWKGNDTPQTQQMVMIFNPMLFARGWRARDTYPVSTEGGAK